MASCEVADGAGTNYGVGVFVFYEDVAADESAGAPPRVNALT
jgi:hypothetical protein